MSDQQDLQDLLPEIQNVPKEEIKHCDMPISIYLQEVENLHTRAKLDLHLLTPVGMSEALLDKLLKRAGALRTAQANWAEENSQQEEAMQTWKQEMPSLYDLRSDLIDHMEFAYRHNERLLKKLDEIKEGHSHADAIQDLANLAVLGQKNPEPLQAINYDLTKLELAANEADRMAGVLAQANGYWAGDNQFKLTRDQAFTLLKTTVDEVRSYGQFVFRKDPDHASRYSSKYNRDRKAEYRRKQANAPV